MAGERPAGVQALLEHHNWGKISALPWELFLSVGSFVRINARLRPDRGTSAPNRSGQIVGLCHSTINPLTVMTALTDCLKRIYFWQLVLLNACMGTLSCDTFAMMPFCVPAKCWGAQKCQKRKKLWNFFSILLQIPLVPTLSFPIK